MKQRGLLYGVLAAAALALAGCQGEPGEGPATGGEVRFSGGIAGMTRAAGTQWDAGDTIGISAAEGVKYVNRSYRTAAGGATGAFQPVGEADKIYYETAGSEGFKAYYPYSSTLTAAAPYITASTADQSLRKEFDFLYGEGSGSRNRPEVSLTFTHRMARFVLTIVPDEGTSLEEVKAASYTLSNLVEEGQFNAFTGEAAATGSTVGDWNITTYGKAGDAGVTCDLILFPQQFESGKNLTLTITVGGQELEAAFDFSRLAGNDGNRLRGGVQYNQTVRIKKTGLVVGECEIRNWYNGGGGSIDATIPHPIGEKTAEEAAIGDYYFSDGSFADKNANLTPKQKSECVGVCFYVGRPLGDGKDMSDYSTTGIKQKECHGYVVALNNASDNSRWATSNFAVGCGTDRNNDWGMYYNHLQFEKHGISQFPAANACKNYTPAAPANSSGWCLPTSPLIRCLVRIGDDRDSPALVAANVVKAGGRSYRNTGWYWCSTEENAGNAFRMQFSSSLDGLRESVPKSYGCQVRPVLAF